MDLAFLAFFGFSVSMYYVGRQIKMKKKEIEALVHLIRSVDCLILATSFFFYN